MTRQLTTNCHDLIRKISIGLFHFSSWSNCDKYVFCQCEADYAEAQEGGQEPTFAKIRFFMPWEFTRKLCANGRSLWGLQNLRVGMDRRRHGDWPNQVSDETKQPFNRVSNYQIHACGERKILRGWLIYLGVNFSFVDSNCKKPLWLMRTDKDGLWLSRCLVHGQRGYFGVRCKRARRCHPGKTSVVVLCLKTLKCP